jgi:hypothetical protein
MEDPKTLQEIGQISHSTIFFYHFLPPATTNSILDNPGCQENISID